MSLANSAGGVTATSDLYATGTAGVTPTAVRTLSGNGSTLFTTILNVSNFTFNNLLLDINVELQAAAVDASGT